MKEPDDNDDVSDWLGAWGRYKYRRIWVAEAADDPEELARRQAAASRDAQAVQDTYPVMQEIGDLIKSSYDFGTWKIESFKDFGELVKEGWTMVGKFRKCPEAAWQGGQRNLDPAGDSVDRRIGRPFVPPPRSSDPNDKLALGGFGDGAYLLPGDLLGCRIRFENKPVGTGPARWIEVTDVLDPAIDLDTLHLVDITFADVGIRVPGGANHYEGLVPLMTEVEEVLVDVQARLDVSSRTLSLTLAVIDPFTGWTPANPFVGVLFPNADLTNPAWERIASRTAGTNGVYEFEDAVGEGTARFYRAVWP